MASSKAEPSFEDIMKASRQKKQNEKFAQSVFGRDRRSSAPGALGKKKGNAVPSLASRVGVTKPAQRVKSSRDLSARASPMPSRPSGLKKELGAGGSLASRIGAAPPTQPKADMNISIRGLAGPAIVMGSNFAPGTTAADIQSAMEPVGGQMQSCRIVTARPTVIAEMVFNDRSGAEAVIETFNNQKADGRLLHIYLKTGPGGQNLTAPAQPEFERPQPPRIVADRFDDYDNNYDRVLRDGERVERSEGQFQDGRFGFDAPQAPKQEMDVVMDDQRDDRGDDRGDGRGDGRSDGRSNDRGNGRRYNDDRRNGHRDERSFRPRDGPNERYDREPRDGRMYNDRMSYRGRGFR